MLGNATAPCMGTSRHTAGKGSGWQGHACAREFEVITCISQSGSLVPSTLHPSCGISQMGTLPYASSSSNHKCPSQNTCVVPLQGSEPLARQHPVMQEVYAACLGWGLFGLSCSFA